MSASARARLGVFGLTSALTVGAVACGDVKTTGPGCDSSLTVTPVADTVLVGETARIRALVSGCISGSPAIVWSISNDTVATITTATDTVVVVTGRRAGQTIVLATPTFDPNLRSAALVTVLPLPPPAVVR